MSYMRFRLVPKSVTLNGVMAFILRYFTEFVYDVVVKKFTFAISYDAFLVINLETVPFGKINEYCYRFTHGLLYVFRNTLHRFFWLIMCVTFCLERMSQV